MIVTKQNIYQVDFQEGSTILIDKPAGWTSFDVVNKIRGTLRHKFGYKKIKVGHGGTLDPLATGLLIICTGRNTKLLASFQDGQKCYRGLMILGETTASYDAETPVEKRRSIEGITHESIMDARGRFLGKIDQIPPIYSAIKKAGTPLYKHARRGDSVEIASRPVEIFKFDLLNYDLPEISFEVCCSKGTYIRSLVFDFGESLSCGAYLKKLVRTSSGKFELSDAWIMEDLITELTSINQSS